MCVFNGFFMSSRPDFSHFGHKDISCRARNRMLNKIVFRQTHVFFPSACFFDIISVSVPAGFSKVLLALVLDGTSKSHVCEKICIHLV